MEETAFGWAGVAAPLAMTALWPAAMRLLRASRAPLDQLLGASALSASAVGALSLLLPSEGGWLRPLLVPVGWAAGWLLVRWCEPPARGLSPIARSAVGIGAAICAIVALAATGDPRPSAEASPAEACEAARREFYKNIWLADPYRPGVHRPLTELSFEPPPCPKLWLPRFMRCRGPIGGPAGLLVNHGDLIQELGHYYGERSDGEWSVVRLRRGRRAVRVSPDVLSETMPPRVSPLLDSGPPRCAAANPGEPPGF